MSILENMVESQYTHRFSIELDGMEISRAFAQEIQLNGKRYHYLEDVWTHPDYRGKWLASKVLWTLLFYVAHDPFSHGVILATRYGRDVSGTNNSLIWYYENLWWKICWREYRMDWKDGKWKDHTSNENPQGYGVMMYRPSSHTDNNNTFEEVIQRVIPLLSLEQEKVEWILSEIIQSGATIHENKSYLLFAVTNKESFNYQERINIVEDFSGKNKFVIACIQASILES